MFNPTREQVREMFFETWRKYRAGHPISGIETLPLDVVLAHPERMAAVQKRPELADYFAEIGLLLQGNLQCFSDPAGSPTPRVVERYLLEGRYFLLRSDLHNLASLPMRLEGLKRATSLVGEETVDRLTVENPRQLLPPSPGYRA